MSEVPLKVLGPLSAEELTFLTGEQAMLAVTPGPKTRNPKPET